VLSNFCLLASDRGNGARFLVSVYCFVSDAFLIVISVICPSIVRFFDLFLVVLAFFFSVLPILLLDLVFYNQSVFVSRPLTLPGQRR